MTAAETVTVDREALIGLLVQADAVVLLLEDLASADDPPVTAGLRKASFQVSTGVFGDTYGYESDERVGVHCEIEQAALRAYSAIVEKTFGHRLAQVKEGVAS